MSKLRTIIAMIVDVDVDVGSDNECQMFISSLILIASFLLKVGVTVNVILIKE